MRILHISDLHIGAHNENLLGSLKNRVRSLKPDVILATGDFADGPYEGPLTRARDYLLELAKLCPQRSEGPSLIAVPGNHDVAHFAGNFVSQWSAANYFKIFANLSVAAFYPSERVWIYGFNSTREKGVGANGQVSSEDLNSFDIAYENAKDTYKQDFENAFKIVALHHHPLPIRYSAKYSRWVTLLNAAEFLEQMLKHDVDLIVHGHEHVHAQATFGKRFKEHDRGLAVVSVGTVFHRNAGDDHNRFNLIQIASDGAVDVESYEARGGTFDADAIDRYAVRSTAQSDMRRFAQIIKEKKYSYQRVIVRSAINEDGDAERSVEFGGLVLQKAKSERARNLHISLPQTSGYIDVPSAWEIIDGDKEKELVFKRVDKTNDDKRVTGVIDYGRILPPGVPLSLRCRWWAVNAMAMSKDQSSKKYAEPRFEEYTHFPILDPVEQLTIMVSFPPGFSPNARPDPFVAKIADRPGQGLHVEERDAALEQKLRDSIVVDGSVKEGLRASLRLARPSIGYTYGFLWGLPDTQEPDGGAAEGETADIVDALLKFRKIKDSKQQEKLKNALGLAGEFVRERLAPKYNGHLEFGLMVFDLTERKMFNVAACQLRRMQFEWVDHDHLIFEYGEGIAGKAFMTKKGRVYTRLNPSRSKRTGPDYFREVPGGPAYAVLFSMPVFHPSSDKNVYAVLNCGSSQKSCPLRELGSNGIPVTRDDVKLVQLTVSKGLHDDLTAIFLNDS